MTRTDAEGDALLEQLRARIEHDPSLTIQQAAHYVLVLQSQAHCGEACCYKIERDPDDLLGELLIVTHTAEDGAESHHGATGYYVSMGVIPEMSREMARIGRDLAPLHAGQEG